MMNIIPLNQVWEMIQNALKEITFNWSVGNNPPPTISDNTFTIVENAADGTSVGTIYPSDTAGDGTSVFFYSQDLL